MIGSGTNDTVSATGNRQGPDVKLILASIAAGAVYFFLSDAARDFCDGQLLPDSLKHFWYAYPAAGTLLVGVLSSVAAHWSTGIVVGLALALVVRQDYWFFGSIATGAWLMMALLVRVEGWYAMLQIGPEFWLAMRLDALRLDPFGTISALFALALCTGLWGRILR